MNCQGFEKLIALYVEGDLTGRKLEQVRQHVDCCASCRRFAHEMGESQGLLKKLNDEPLDELALRSVEHRVLQQIVDPARTFSQSSILRLLPTWQWPALGAAGALMLFVVLLLWPWSIERNPRRKVPSAGSEMATRPPKIPEPSRLTQTTENQWGSPRSKGRASNPEKGFSPSTNARPRGPSQEAETRKKGPTPESLGIDRPEEVAAAGPPARQGGIRPQDIKVGPMGSAKLEAIPVELPSIQTANFDIPEPANQMVIKWVTEDPNIVIVWLIDQKRGKENAQN